MSSQLDRAERERKAEEAKAAQLAKMQARYAAKGATSDFFDTPPPAPPSSAPAEPPGLLSGCLKCFAGETQAQPAHAVTRQKSDIREGLTEYATHLEAHLTAQQNAVIGSRDRVQREFDSVAAFVPVEAATRLGSEKSAAVRKQMWELLCAQVESGLGMPTEAQLSSLWSKYDGNGDGNLSKTEMRQMLIDYSAAMYARLSKHLPTFQKRLQAGFGTLNPFVETLTRAFMYECESQLALYRAQAEGRLTQAQVSLSFTKMDTSRDGRITRDEFMAKATGVFFATLLEDVTNDAMVASMSAAVSDSSSGTRPSLVFQSLEKAEREAAMAQQSVDAARKRMRRFTSYSTRLSEEAERMEREVAEGAHAISDAVERYAERLQATVRRDGASTLVALEQATAGGSDEDARAKSVRMFEILSKQLAGGMGKPSEEQLQALWTKYDEDGNGALSRGELAHLISDYATARAGEIRREELPALEAVLESEKDNQFACLLTRARLLAKQAELELFVSQAEGQLADADLKNAFAALDVNHDGRISKHEFFTGAADVIFATQLERLKKWKAVLQDAVSATPERQSQR